MWTVTTTQLRPHRPPQQNKPHVKAPASLQQRKDTFAQQQERSSSVSSLISPSYSTTTNPLMIMKSSSFKHLLFTKEDAIASFNLFCGVCGIGTLGMPANFARATPLYGLFAMAFMGFANIYASVVVSKTMLLAPRRVKTFGDLGEWVYGSTGRYVVVVSQMLVCLLTASAFLVLGGTILSSLFPKAFGEVFWIGFMALMVLPVALMPTMKEGASAAFAGCMGTIVADAVGVGILLHAMAGHPQVPPPNVSLEQIATTFGNLALAYGGAVVIPTIQRQHHEPQRMPFVIGATLCVATALFVALASAGYAAVGCQMSGNLLFSVFPDSETGLSLLGFASPFGSATISYLFMQLHITIAFAVFLHPAFYILERMFLGMHTAPEDEEDEEGEDQEEEGIAFVAVQTPTTTTTTTVGITVQDDTQDKAVLLLPASGTSSSSSSSSPSSASPPTPLKTPGSAHHSNDEYKGIRHVILRLAVIALLVCFAILLRHKFIDLTDFIGACCSTVLCIIVPIVFYLKKCHHEMPVYEKAVAIVTIIVCALLGSYVTYKSGKQLVWPAPEGVKFPFCEKQHQDVLYYTKPKY